MEVNESKRLEAIKFQWLHPLVRERIRQSGITVCLGNGFGKKWCMRPFTKKASLCLKTYDKLLRNLFCVLTRHVAIK